MPRGWNHVPDPTPDATHCPDCGAPLPGGLGACRALFHELNAGQGGFYASSLRLGRIMSDAYTLQHLEPYCRTAKELTYHLASLCCGLEYEGSPAVYKALQKSIDGKFVGERPTPPTHLGDLTVVHLSSAVDQEDYTRRIQEWAESVWEAYSDLQDSARAWVKRALG